MIYRRCMSKNHPPNEQRFHDKREPCPHCGDEMSAISKHLTTAKLNSHLYGQVERQHKEVEFAKRAQTEKEPR